MSKMEAPYFGGKSLYSQGGYLTVQQNVGKDIDWYNVQFYNQGSSDYSTFATLFQSANGWAANTAVYQMINGNNDMKFWTFFLFFDNNAFGCIRGYKLIKQSVKIPAEMIVVGKPCTTGDVDNTGYVAPSTMESIFAQAVSNQNVIWNTGFMTWQFASDLDQNFQFANTVAQAF
ncbi:hypothetical protein RFI_06844 [Reticulomyxa filosa]|uniref:GH18 domain-containing protein n=1 Tax=Reticulomyxa filosa TaxID=46433 RepID=X6NYA8_RETFI|nr:hypothetical protein RFI_06844 [Reticulomyxa filosa]|eukprot:ETO30277.1 hypothetical protein RFI_06844 [Reticulomyxa filosa]